jgi:hypothetical protein
LARTGGARADPTSQFRPRKQGVLGNVGTEMNKPCRCTNRILNESKLLTSPVDHSAIATLPLKIIYGGSE